MKSPWIDLHIYLQLPLKATLRAACNSKNWRCSYNRLSNRNGNALLFYGRCGKSLSYFISLYFAHTRLASILVEISWFIISNIFGVLLCIIYQRIVEENRLKSKGYMDQMVGVFSQSSDPSEALLKNPGSSSLLKQDHHHQPLPTPDEPSPPSTVLIPSSSNSSLEVQSREQQQQTHQHQQPQAQDRPMTMGTDPQESGVRLVHMLMACAEAVQENRSIVAGKMVKDIRSMAYNQGGAMGKVATYFAEALTLRIYGSLPQDALLNHNDSVSEQLLHIHFYESCPYLKFAYFTANQAILEAFADHKRVHIIDFNLKQGMQWPALIQALALRPGGPPAFRLTGIGPRQPDGSDVLQEVGMKLAHLAESVNVEFSFRGYVVSNLSNLKPWMLDIKPGVEAVAVNSILQLHRLIDDDPSQPSSSIDQVLAMVRSLNPK